MDVLKGDHCAVSTCKQFDFLPFKCDSCGKTYCLDHRGQSAHNCDSSNRPELKNIIPQCPICNAMIIIASGEDPNAKMDLHIRSNCTQYKIDDGNVSDKKSDSNNFNHSSKGLCGYSKCKSKRAPIECHDCHKFFCPEHRFPQDHMCGKNDSSSSSNKGESKGLKMLAAMGITRPNNKSSGGSRGTPLGQNKNNSSSSKSGLRSSTEETKEEEISSSNKKKSLTPETEKEIYQSRIRMRDVAIGNSEIESERRFYCRIQFSSKINKKELVIFFDKNKTIGRILDEICDERNIKNKNHLPDSDKLVLVCVRTGGPLPYDLALHLLEPELMSGDTLLLRYESEA